MLGVMMFLDRGFLIIGNVSCPFNHLSGIDLVHNWYSCPDRALECVEFFHKRIKASGQLVLLRRYNNNGGRLEILHLNWLPHADLWNLLTFQIIPKNWVCLLTDNAFDWTVPQRHAHDS